MPAFNWTTQQIPVLNGRRAIVTGANAGIGFPTALELARHGAEVTLACRSVAKANEARARILKAVPRANVLVEQLDVASLASVHAFAKRELAAEKPLHLLINNAGMMAGEKRETTADGFELMFGTNHLGHFALTGLLLPLLKIAEQQQRVSSGAGFGEEVPPRVVTVASVAHKQGVMDFADLQAENGYESMKSYRQSKLSNLLFSFELDRRLKRAGSGVVSVAAHPGVARTNILKPGPNPTMRNRVVGMIIKLIGPAFNSDADGALPTLFAATAPLASGQATRQNAPLVHPGAYYGPQGLMEIRGGDVGPAQISDAAKDTAAATRLWEISETLSGVRYLD